MTPFQLRAIVEELHLNTAQLGHFLGYGGDHEVRRWLAGDMPIPASVARILRHIVQIRLIAKEEARRA